ncbi:MAG: hypothetical protein LBD45_05625 [Bacteroidales bacterium]|nr:hypothetical protein [Bacteroidales bacterium]
MLPACDSGDIYPEEKNVEVLDVSVNAAFKLQNISVFPERYTLLFATFIGASPYPTSFYEIAKPENEDIFVSLSRIPKGTASLKLCLADKVENKLIHAFYTYLLDETPVSSIVIPSVTVDLADFGRVQAQVFSQCIQCHGGGSSVAAGLNLTESLAYSNLLNVESTLVDGKKRVFPGSSQQSFIMEVLENQLAVRYDHTKISTLRADDISLLKTWIDAGATN